MAFSIRNSRLVSVGLAGVIAVGVIGVGSVALAQEPGGGAPDAGQRAHHPVKVGFAGLVKDSGVTRDEMKDGSDAGLTLGAIIDQYGDVSAAEAKANALAALSERLDEAVANGDVDADRAAEIEVNAPALLDRLLARVPGQFGDNHPHAARALKVLKHSLDTVAEVLGTDVATVRGALADGGTIADLAGDQAQAVVDALTADANAAIDEAVANGNLPAERAGEAKERAAAAIQRFVNEPHPKLGGAHRP